MENLLMNQKLSEYHTGYRAFSKEVLRGIDYHKNSDDFVFDNQMLAQVVHFGFRVGEISTPTRYVPESSSINFGRSIRYGFGVVGTSIRYRLHRMGVVKATIFSTDSMKALPEYYQQIDTKAPRANQTEEGA